MNYTNLNHYLAALPSTKVTSHDTDMLQAAGTLAALSNCRPHRLGAVIYRKRRVLGKGTNEIKSHPLQARFNKWSINLHAEISAAVDALRECPQDIEGSTIAVSRVNRTNLRKCSYPCVHCMAALRHLKVRRIVCYNASDEVTGINLT